MKAVVVGGTGAIGEQVVGELLTNGAWQTVVTVGRRTVTVPECYKPSEYKAKLEQVVVDMDQLQAAPAFQGAHSVFCCLGTTRKVAGSAEGFKKVDYEYVKATAEAAKAGGASHFALVSAQGANPRVWANDWGVLHGLLYTRTKGLAEEAAKAQGFASTAIYRPGLLDRGDKMRSVERTAMKLGWNSISVQGVAHLMVKNAAAFAASPAGVAAVRVWEMGELQNRLKQEGWQHRQ